MNDERASRRRGGADPTADADAEATTPRAPGPINLNRYGVEVSWAGIQTFMKLPVCQTPEDLRAGRIDVAIGGAPWDGTNMDRGGAHLGPRAIRAAGVLSPPYDRPHQHTRVDPFSELRVCDYADAEIVVGDSKRTYDNIRAFVSEILEGGAIPIILGGDHGITWPSATAVANSYGFGNIGIVHFDAHADTASDFKGNLYSNGSPVRRLVESRAIRGADVVQVGLRGYWQGPDVREWMDDQAIRTHYMAEVDIAGFGEVLNRVINEALEGPENVYLTVDIDSVDPAYAPGTGAPEPGGLSSRELLQGVRRVAAEVGIVAMDVVEVSPPYDTGIGITAKLAHYCVLEALTGIAMRRRGLTAPNYVDALAAGRQTRAAETGAES